MTADDAVTPPGAMTTAAIRLAVDEPVGELEVVHLFDGAMPTGVTVSHSGRVFVCYPKWGDEVGFTVGEIRDGREVAFPSQELNDDVSDADPERLVSVQSVVGVGPLFRPTSTAGWSAS
jgi:hypothetical protein